jgi:thiamine pyrophosphokinase
MKKCIILANGKPPQKHVISHLMKRNYSTLFCADGGANTALKMALVPDYIIGDLDSISTKTLNFYRERTKIIKLNRQNDTDVEKCLKKAVKLKFDEAILTGATGNRLDHTFCNLGIVIKFFEKIKIEIIAENSLLTPYTGTHTLNTFPGETISIYGIGGKTKISFHGLKYKLNNTSLPFGEKESTSNIALENQVKLKVDKGIIFVIRDFQLMRKNGLI